MLYHGPEAYGTDRAPALVGRRVLRAQSLQQLRDLIRGEIPASGMPAFDLPAQQLDALAAFIHALNSPAAETVVLGDAMAAANYSSARGDVPPAIRSTAEETIGPDLSSVAREMTVDEIWEELRPSAHVTPGYELVTITFNDAECPQ